MVEELHAPEQPVLIPVAKPLSLIPVGLKEAALDSPTFRATALHFSEQIDALEKWLENYVKAATKLNHEVAVLEGLANTFLTASNPPSQLSEAVFDHDYTLLALRRYGEGAREFWAHTFGGIKKAERSMLDPIKNFLASDLKSFKESRRILDQTQRHFDSLLARYSGQSKTKESSSLREDAFQLHEARKAYLKASMDFCIFAPQLRSSIDSLLIKVFSEQWLEMKESRENKSELFAAHAGEIDRIRSWSQEVGRGARVLRRELQNARKQIEDSAEHASRPSRELDDYAVSTVPFIGTGLSISTLAADSAKPAAFAKQGYLFLRTATGKPARTAWIRRWFFVKNGIFGWLTQGHRSGGVEESEKIGVLLCSIRPAFQEDRRFCFEVKTKDTTIILQAETQSDLTEWISSFEIAKQLALEDSTTHSTPGASGNPTADAAYAVSPATAPELAAKGPDGQVTSINEELAGPERSATLSISDNEGNFLGRSSYDPDGGSGRDHAARILQKLDIHRKTSASPQISGTSTPPPPQPTGGIASLISASHTALPVGPGRPRPSPMMDTWSAGIEGNASSSLSPNTLVNPPSATNLSRTAVFVSGDRGLDLGVVDNTGGVPSSLMANQWGSANYGHLSRIDRGEVKPSRSRLEPEQTSLSNRSSPQRSPHESFEGQQVDVTVPMTTDKLESIPSSAAQSPVHPGHKSVTQISGLSRPKRTVSGYADFPNYYPSALRAQDAQFRMLFPNVPPEERVVLVFRASWNPNEHQDLPGRVYVTTQEILFYSHHQGLVMVSGVSLSNIAEVTTSSGKECDFVTLYLKDRDRRDESGKIRIKTFLESVRLLHRRLSYLVSNCNAENPDSPEEVMKYLIRLEAADLHRSSSAESWEDVSATSPADESRRDYDGMTGIRVDRNLFNDFHEPKGPDAVARFKLPTQPVEYTPQDVTRLVCERDFQVSAKALFHIMFGDQSAVFQILYQVRRAQILTQYPWTKNEQGAYSRSFEYEASSGGTLNRRTITVIDTQTVDVANDHLCYVVTDRKTPWHLPSYQNFSLLSKIVITHSAKSKCRLAIFTAVSWHRRRPLLLPSIIERYALEELDIDALDVAAVAADQVDKLGDSPPTRRAIQIFGYIGQQTEATQLTSTAASLLPATQSRRFHITPHSLPHLLSKSAASTLRALASLRAAASYMHRLGVGPAPALARAVYLADLDPLFAAPPLLNVSAPDEDVAARPCLAAFQTQLALAAEPYAAGAAALPAMTTATSRAALRLRRAREALATYRHELLVAVRLVNAVERETVRAEWEGWVRGEVGRCSGLKEVLSAGAGRGNATRKGRKKEEDGEGVREWFEGYCESCVQELEGVSGVR